MIFNALKNSGPPRCEESDGLEPLMAFIKILAEWDGALERARPEAPQAQPPEHGTWRLGA